MDMKFFDWEHLPEKLQIISSPICNLAHELNDMDELNDFRMNKEEKEIGLRKLLEAKDCFVRAAIY